jgi:hypothetical protein
MNFRKFCKKHRWPSQVLSQLYLGLRHNSVNITVTPAEFRTSFFFPNKGIQHCRYANSFAILCESGRSYVQLKRKRRPQEAHFKQHRYSITA